MVKDLVRVYIHTRTNNSIAIPIFVNLTTYKILYSRCFFPRTFCNTHKPSAILIYLQFLSYLVLILKQLFDFRNKLILLFLHQINKQKTPRCFMYFLIQKTHSVFLSFNKNVSPRFIFSSTKNIHSVFHKQLFCFILIIFQQFNKK